LVNTKQREYEKYRYPIIKNGNGILMAPKIKTMLTMKLNTEEYIFLTNDTGTTTEHHKCENQEFQPNSAV
jgi:hypothetical protein